MERRELLREVARVHWFHQIDLGQGVVTPGVDPSSRKLKRIALPEDLRGQTVLDVGAWDGFFSFEAERRGAKRVVALDPATWRTPPAPSNPWSGRAGFDLARRALRSGVEDVDIDLLDLSPERIGTFDLVLFLGVLYHLPDPFPVLERIASVTAGRLIVETHADLLHVRRPALAFYPSNEVGDDESNWWGPNVAMLEASLGRLGFSRVEERNREGLAYRAARSFYHRLRGERFLVQQGRCVVHAFR